MKIICALYLLGCLCHQISAGIDRSDQTTSLLAQILETYLVSEDRVNWYDAHRGCRIRNMHLISISDDTENENINKFRLWSYNGYWTSGTNLGTNRTFYKWTGNGLPVTYTNWKEPPSGDGNNCIAFSYTGYWFDADCGGLKGYICQHDPKPTSDN